MELNYIKCGDYYIPDLRLPPQPEEPLTKYGRMRLNFLKEYRPATYNMMLLDGTLKAHCLEIQEQAQNGGHGATDGKGCRCDRGGETH